ncbi:MAG TPA: hypothetical protein VF556_04340 [Pyrinomonadaceae bacterium]|jgi:hypothetical protein
MYRKLLLFSLLVLFTRTSFSQATNTKAETKAETKIETKAESDISAELKKQAVEFLRESAGEVNNLRTLENRISLASEMAALMWLHDEKEARTMINFAVNDFRQLIVRYDSEITAQGIEMPEGDSFYGGFFRSRDDSDKANLLRKVGTAMGPVRQQITLSIAEHDPQFALNFYNDSLQLLSNAAVRKGFEERNSYFETQLLNRIAENHPAKAVELGRKSLAKGLNYNHIELLKKIYAKEAEKGADFGADVAKKLKEERVDPHNFEMLGVVLRLGAENIEAAKKNDKKPMFAEDALRELADLTAQTILQRPEYENSRGKEYLNLIEKFAPSRAVQIRAQREARMKSATGEGAGVGASLGAAPSPAAISTPRILDEKNEQAEMMKSLQDFGKKQMPKEEREKIIGQARKIIAATPNRQQKILALSALGAQVAKFGDKELAAEIMKDAQNLISSPPKNFLDFMEVWMLAGGLAAADPEKAYPLLEDAILRLNDTLSAFIKVGEFMDVSGEMIDDGEIQIGKFGSSMIKELMNNLAMADATLLTLAKNDFTKTKALTNKFDRPEARILAKMLILRAVLGDKKKPIGETSH